MVRCPLLTVGEVAAITRLSGKTIRRWICAGRIPVVHLGRNIRISQEDIQNIIDASREIAVPSVALAGAISADDTQQLLGWSPRDRARDLGPDSRPTGRWSGAPHSFSSGDGPRGQAPGCRGKTKRPQAKKAVVHLVTKGIR